MEISVAVVREKFGSFTIEKLQLTDPRPDEALVRIVASGMCQTDLHGRDGYYNGPYPAVYGHEGAGIVQAVGKDVTRFAPGDHVVISFPWCGACPNCRRDLQFHCMQGFDLKMRGTRADGSTLMSKDGAPVYSAFFQLRYVVPAARPRGARRDPGRESPAGAHPETGGFSDAR
jgi:aryl-alcohol dehydrogenase